MAADARTKAIVVVGVLAGGVWCWLSGGQPSPEVSSVRTTGSSESAARAESKAIPSNPADVPLSGFDPREREARLDGVEHAIPMLAGRSPEEQLRSLQWMQRVPGFKVVSLFPDLRDDGRTSYYEREAAARARLRAEIHKLQREGVSAPEPGLDFQAARIGDTLSADEISALEERNSM